EIFPERNEKRQAAGLHRQPVFILLGSHVLHRG
ncbi:MAG: hypothetical protein AVDCRST_MAG56-6937, partial [uncultured Cytophagales bacterium]